MAKVYLETSFFSAGVSDRRDIESLARQAESRRWWVQQRQHFELFISPEVIRELSDARYSNRIAAIALTVDCTRLEITNEVRGLAKVLVREKLMPGPAEQGDALHVAVSLFHKCDYLLTWNIRQWRIETNWFICGRFACGSATLRRPS